MLASGHPHSEYRAARRASCERPDDGCGRSLALVGCQAHGLDLDVGATPTRTGRAGVERDLYFQILDHRGLYLP